ncbi:hypothetical protein ACJMK2_026931 [Sinanodonta woodiana]|uniref:Uncharacterized protein n=1 Tax=Sinanodonta woodiana TaxID=1069815 RepID=A0ABD3XPR1_SINWO
MEIVPEPALKALFGLGLKSATNWSLRAAEKRTTLLLVWDQDDKQENRGNLKFRRGRGKRRPKRGNQPKPQGRENQRAATPPPTLQPRVSEDEHTKTSTMDLPVLGSIALLQKRIEELSNRLDSIFEPGYIEELAPSTSQIISMTPADIPDTPEPQPTPSPPPPNLNRNKRGRREKRLLLPQRHQDRQ